MFDLEEVAKREISRDTTEALVYMGIEKAGWFKGSMSIGLTFLGPAFGAFLVREAIDLFQGFSSWYVSDSYLHDAYLWAVLDYSSAGTNFTVTGNFGDAVPMGNSAELSGQIQTTMTYCGMHWEQRQFDIRVRGNGYGVMRQL